MFCWVEAGQNVGKLNNVGGESKSPPGMRNRDESGDPRIVHRKQSGRAKSNNIFLMCMLVL